MKLLSLARMAFLFISLGAVMSSCVKGDFDEPPINIPYVDFESNLSIDSLKIKYPGVLQEITDDVIIQGIITATDESGNFYKTLEIQDNTAGIELKLDKTSLYTEYKVGQRLYIKCKGLYIGQYGGMTQLGYIYNGAIGRLPEVYFAAHLFKDSLPGPAPVPANLTIPQLSPKYLSSLVQLQGIHFDDVGQPVANAVDDYTHHNIVDDLGNSIILRTSKYANFAASLLPSGKGNLTGILSVYNGDYQFYVRDMNDFVAFDTTIGFQQTIIEEVFDADPAGWVKYSVASNKDWYWSSQYSAMVANGYGGDVASDDWLVSPAVNLNGVEDPILTFRSWTKFTDGGLTDPMVVLISTDYSGSGNPATATWTPLSCTLPAPGSASWTGSGDIDLSAYTQPVYIAFHYRTSGTGSGTTSQWEIDAFKITGIK